MRLSRIISYYLSFILSISSSIQETKSMYATNRRWSHQYYLYSTFIVLFRFYLFINVFSVNLHPTRDDVIPASVVTSWPPQLWRHVDAPSMLFSFVVFFLFFFLFFFIFRGYIPFSFLYFVTIVHSNSVASDIICYYFDSVDSLTHFIFFPFVYEFCD